MKAMVGVNGTSGGWMIAFGLCAVGYCLLALFGNHPQVQKISRSLHVEPIVNWVATNSPRWRILLVAPLGIFLGLLGIALGIGELSQQVHFP
ncbi:MAG TPA: hypothetical protein VHT92_06775, partial [Candidatus Cybelea sp.]|nr:hypothetical protein [Candidatus Cybelea sp.]